MITLPNRWDIISSPNIVKPVITVIVFYTDHDIPDWLGVQGLVTSVFYWWCTTICLIICNHFFFCPKTLQLEPKPVVDLAAFSVIFLFIQLAAVGQVPLKTHWSSILPAIQPKDLSLPIAGTAEINTSVPAGVYLFPNPRQRFALRIWPGTIQVSRSRWMPSFIHSSPVLI